MNFPFIFKTVVQPLALSLVLALSASAVQAARADYPSQRRQAMALVQQKKYDQAIETFEKMAQEAEMPANKTDAYGQAAMAAVAKKDFKQAMEFAGKIPDEQVALLVQLRVASINKNPKGLLELAGDKDLAQWADVNSGEALFLRGKAYEDTSDYQNAATDLEEAMKRLGQSKLWAEAGMALANIYGTHLDSTDKAIATYQLVIDVEAVRDNHGWGYATAVINKASSQASKGDTDAALNTLNQIDLATRISGYWAAMFRQAHAKVLVQRGEKPKAIAMLKEAIALPKVPESLKTNLQKQLDDLQSSDH